MGRDDALNWYDANAAALALQYESIGFELVHDWLIDFIPVAPSLVLDIGAGSGRDAAWLAARGHEVVAVEPAASLRAEAMRLHADSRISWVDDRLPSLEHVRRLGLSFDFILASAVWMHVSPGERSRAFRKLMSILKPGGFLAITLRHGPIESRRPAHPVDAVEIEQLARSHGAFVERTSTARDRLGRSDVTWTQIIVRLPDDGTGALPLLRHIILNDDKSSTYKLALLRVLCRIADGAAGYARKAEDGYVAVPLGLVGLYWIRMFKPLLAANLPQSPANRGDRRLGFVKDDGFRRLADVSHLDLRISTQFAGARSAAIHAALRHACGTITQMPAHYMTYPGGEAILPVKRPRRVPPPSDIRLDEAYLSAFGTLLVPEHLWRALQRFDVWIEPALLAEWSSLMQGYAARQGRRLNDAVIAAAMCWSEPERDVRFVREQARRLMDGTALHCVWSGQKLSAATLDIDHCFPWSAWPCNDLWNLLPAHRRVNQNQKRQRLPDGAVLRSARDRIQEWWHQGYLEAENRLLSRRFMVEAVATLPLAGQEKPTVDDVFMAIEIQRLRLKHDQQIPEWTGAT